MAELTTNYDFYLPDINGDEAAWGQMLNANMTALDEILATIAGLGVGVEEAPTDGQNYVRNGLDNAWNAALSSAELDLDLANYVALTGDQTVAGVKTFSSSVKIPNDTFGVGWAGKLEAAPKGAIYEYAVAVQTSLTDLQLQDIELQDNIDAVAGSLEESTWALQLWDNSLSGSEGQVYTNQVGFYSRDGSRVSIQGTLKLSGLGTLTGAQQARIGPLPFTSNSTSGYIAYIPMYFNIGLVAHAYEDIFGLISANTNYITLFRSVSSGLNALLVSDFDENETVYVSGFYFTD